MSTYDWEIEEIRKILLDAECVVFFGGAGVSTDSGIPDFRGNQGLYRADEEGDAIDKEYLMSHDCLYREPERFFEFYHNSIAYPDAKPNDAHLILARLEEIGVIRAIITQNIDGLHQEAGSKRVLELHGSCSRWYCMSCGEEYDKTTIDSTSGIPRCKHCNGMIRPDIVLYQEGLNGSIFDEAAEEIANADVLIVGGTSLTVHPAASLIHEFEGKALIIINQSPTPYDGIADYVIHDSLADVLRAIVCNDI